MTVDEFLVAYDGREGEWELEDGPAVIQGLAYMQRRAGSLRFARDDGERTDLPEIVYVRG